MLKKYVSHAVPEIAETCDIALDLIEWRKKVESVPKSSYLSVDPAPPVNTQLSVAELQRNLMDKSQSLFLRYRAMFSLRDMNSDDAVHALVTGFKDDSALFRHEIAYVLGQMQRPASISGLKEVLLNTSEHRMVRHEAAEALGAIGGNEVEDILKEFSHDNEVVVQESCVVALDTADYWNNLAKTDSN